MRNINRRNLLRLHALFHAISLQPGLTTHGLAKRLGWKHTFVRSALITLEGEGLLVYEDDSGHLHPFGKGKRMPIVNGERE